MELLLRAVGAHHYPVIVEDPDIGYLPKKNQKICRFGKEIHYNNYHQRSDPLSPSSSFRIFMIGDSILNGGNYIDNTETISEILERQLNQSLGLRGEVLNASAGGWSFYNYCAYIDKFGTFDAEIVFIIMNQTDLFQSKEVIPSNYQSRTGLALEFVIQRLWRAYFSAIRHRSNSQNYVEKNLEYLRKMISTIGAEKLTVLYIPPKNHISSSDRTKELVRVSVLLKENRVRFINAPELAGLSEANYSDGIHLNRSGNQAVAAGLAKLIRSQISEIKTTP